MMNVSLNDPTFIVRQKIAGNLIDWNQNKLKYMVVYTSILGLLCNWILFFHYDVIILPLSENEHVYKNNAY